MPINFSQLLLQPGPSRPLDMPDMSAIAARREQMRLQREEFAERKRQHEELMQFHRMQEENEMARAYLTAQNAEETRRAAIEEAAEKARVDAEAALLAKRQAGGSDFGKAAGAGQVQEMEAMVPYLESLGSGAINLGQVGGLPTYRYVADMKKYQAEEAAKERATAPRGPDETAEQSLARLDHMGYPTNERGTLDDPTELRAPLGTGGVARVDAGAPEFDDATGDAVTDELDPAILEARLHARRQAERAPRPSDEIYGADDVDALPSDAVYGAGEPPPPAPEGMEPGALPMDDAFARALKASAYARKTGVPLRRDEEDFTGAVPRDVIDMAANEKQTLARLQPGLKSLVESYPETHRDSAEKSAEGILNMPGLPLEKRMELYEKARTGVDSAINTNLGIEAQNQRTIEDREARLAAAREARQAAIDKPLTPMDKQSLIQRGYTRANTSYTKEAINTRLDSLKAAETVARLLENGDSYDDPKVVNYLMMLARNKGHQTLNDENRMTGLGTASTIDQAKEWLHERFKGGFGPELRASLIGYARAVAAEEKGQVFGWMDQMHRQADENEDPYVRQGYLDYVNDGITDPDVLKEYESRPVEEEEEEPAPAGGAAPTPGAPAPTGANAPAPGAPRPIGSVHPASYYQPGQKMPADAPRYDGSAAPAADDGFGAELDKQATAQGLDPKAIRKFMGPESGGRADAVSSAGAVGIFQLLPTHIRKLGSTPEKYAAMTRTEQLPIALKYLKSKGLNAESSNAEYAMAVAAPAYMGKPDDTVIKEYAKGSDAWNQNPGWRPKDGGPITVRSILHFYGLRPDDGSTGPAVSSDDGEAPPAGAKKPPASIANTDLDQEVLDMLDQQ